MRLAMHNRDFAGGMIAGVVTGFGIGLLLAPGRGRLSAALRHTEVGRQLSEALSEAGPLVLEVGLVVLSQTRPILGRIAWGIVHLASRPRTRQDIR